MENFINKFIEQNVKGVDTYQHNGSTWLIFTNDKRWVIELTKDKTLWYNYNFFKSIFEFFSMDVVENQQYITKWVEDTIINGVKHTDSLEWKCGFYIEDTIQNGVRHTCSNKFKKWNTVEDTIQNGVKRTLPESIADSFAIEDTIQNGVKHTEYGDWLDGNERLDDIIENGVKETQFNDNENKSWVEGVIKGGVKETNSTNFPNGNCGYIKEILRKGIKTVQPLPAQDGNRDWGNYYHGKEDRTKPFNEYLNEAIEFGVIPKFFLSIHKNYYEHTELFDF